MKINYNEKNCEVCGSLYKYDSRQRVSKYCSIPCRGISFRQKRIEGEENIDFVICEICGLKFKEINNDHLERHGITSIEYDLTYNSPRTSEKTRKNKNTLSQIMCDELSEKLSKSHTIENYKLKYGEEEGIERFNLMLERKKYKNNKQSYIDRFGIDGEEIYNNVQKKKKITLENLINRHGEHEGRIKYDEFLKKRKIKNLLSTYIEKHGYEEGLIRWLDKNNKISISNSKIERDDRDKFKEYIREVNRFTRISLKMNNLDNIYLRGHEHGYDLDHIFSKIDGFKKNIPSYIVGHIRNLKIVEATYNRKKQHKSDISVEDLIIEFENDMEYKKIVFGIINIEENGKN